MKKNIHRGLRQLTRHRSTAIEPVFSFIFQRTFDALHAPHGECGGALAAARRAARLGAAAGRGGDGAVAGVYMSRGHIWIAFLPQHVSTACKGSAHIAPMRCALDGRADEVRVSVLLSAALGGACVRAAPACSLLRVLDHSRLHGADEG